MLHKFVIFLLASLSCLGTVTSWICKGDINPPFSIICLWLTFYFIHWLAAHPYKNVPSVYVCWPFFFQWSMPFTENAIRSMLLIHQNQLSSGSKATRFLTWPNMLESPYQTTWEGHKQLQARNVIGAHSYLRLSSFAWINVSCFYLISIIINAFFQCYPDL